jgi:hypothetical protein
MVPMYPAMHVQPRSTFVPVDNVGQRAAARAIQSGDSETKGNH